MIELTWVGEALKWAGWIYWAFALAILVLVAVKIRPVIGKVIGALVVIAAFGYLPVTAALKNKEIVDARKAALAHFEMRCKGAGEKIYRTVEDVEGVVLLKVRAKATSYNNYTDPMWPGAAFAGERTGDEYIESFLLYMHESPTSRRRNVDVRPSSLPGYQYVEVTDPIDNQRYRYTLSISTKPSDVETRPYYFKKLIREPATGPMPQYAVTFEDIVDPEDRRLWVSGGTVSVIDLQTKEVLGTLTRYAMDMELGNKNQRYPWLGSHICPKVNGDASTTTRFFVDQILKSKQKN